MCRCLAAGLAGVAALVAAATSAGAQPAPCQAKVTVGVLPAWVRTGFSEPKPRMPYALGRSGRNVADPAPGCWRLSLSWSGRTDSLDLRHVGASPSPAAIVHRLRADEAVLRTATGATFVAAARDRQLAIRAASSGTKTAAAVSALAPAERDDIAARRALTSLSAQSPPQVGGVSVGPAPPAGRLLSFYRIAERRFGIRWSLLAAINFVESDFGRARTTAKADAQGPMQFEPATWRQYGLGGNVDDAHDAILAAANLLAANGGRTNERAAVGHYNLSPLYREAVLHLAHRIATVSTAFREYYAWRLYLRKG